MYLPWLGLFHKIALSDTYVSFNDVPYSNGDWNNRNKIKTTAGSVWLTVPVLKSGHLQKPLDEIVHRLSHVLADYLFDQGFESCPNIPPDYMHAYAFCY